MVKLLSVILAKTFNKSRFLEFLATRMKSAQKLGLLPQPRMCSRGSSFVYLVDFKLQSLYNLFGKEASGWSSKRLLACLWAASQARRRGFESLHPLHRLISPGFLTSTTFTHHSSRCSNPFTRSNYVLKLFLVPLYFCLILVFSILPVGFRGTLSNIMRLGLL